MKATLLALSYNEIDGVKAIMPKIDHKLLHEIIVVDGGSTDGTIEWLNANGYKVVVQTQPGLGSAYREGLKVATGDIIITFSPDGNSLPDRIPALIEKMTEGPDVVTVSRYLGDAKSEDDDFVTAIGNWLFTKAYNILFGQSVTDYLVMYRAFKTTLVKELDINHGAISWQSQLMCRAARAGKDIQEIDGDEPARIGGKRKMNPIRNGLAELLMLAQEFKRR
jgi:glycosyltransferase involved in cell wall biosynthesis